MWCVPAPVRVCEPLATSDFATSRGIRLGVTTLLNTPMAIHRYAWLLSLLILFIVLCLTGLLGQ